mmetsp:Transcript_21434/g.36778  ORF Transcript_21434/g.36778 Transcript_21434/m.36778 type:complete len:90 (-) Transcript_21434:526-795(-)
MQHVLEQAPGRAFPQSPFAALSSVSRDCVRFRPRRLFSANVFQFCVITLPFAPTLGCGVPKLLNSFHWAKAKGAPWASVETGEVPLEYS